MDYKTKPTPKFKPAPFMDFELYLKENCHNKIQLLDRETFPQIKHPIFITFNHYREKCVYHHKKLREIYDLALKYDEHIEFIAADISDIDVIYRGRNPFNYFCRLVPPEQESCRMYVIDEKKRIYQIKKLDDLYEICEKLLNGLLFPSQPEPENNDKNPVKLCVELNYEKLVLKSEKNILFIVNLERRREAIKGFNLESVALSFQNYNLDIVYMEADKNYVPIIYEITSYPAIIFIPQKDKENFIYYRGPEKENNLRNFLHCRILGQPEILIEQETNSIEVPYNFEMDFQQLSEFFQQNFSNKFKILDRDLIKKSKYHIVIIFMDFPDMKCLDHHIQWFNKLYQVIALDDFFQYFVGDFKDIDIINPKWLSQDLRKASHQQPKIYAFDSLKHTYELKNFRDPSSLFYFTSSLQNQQFYYSEAYAGHNDWTADNINIFLSSAENHIFLTFYSSDDENFEQLSELLDTIEDEFRDKDVEVLKYDIKYNYVDLEYVHDKYPVHYFIPKNNKMDKRIYMDKSLDKEKIMEFIKKNVKEFIK